MNVQKLKEANEQLKAAVDAALAAAVKPEMATVAHLEDEGRTQTYSLVRGVWMETFPGLRVMLIDDSGHCGTCPSSYLCPEVGCTRVLAEAKRPVHLPKHTHAYHETVHVIEGVFRDDLMEASYHRKGSQIFYKAHTPHEPILSGLFLICWSPPLSREEISRQIAKKRGLPCDCAACTPPEGLEP